LDPGTTNDEDEATSASDSVATRASTAKPDAHDHRSVDESGLFAAAPTDTPGFLGPHVADSFEHSGHTVVCISKEVLNTYLRM
jgi:hypothetical protein